MSRSKPFERNLYFVVSQVPIQQCLAHTRHWTNISQVNSKNSNSRRVYSVWSMLVCGVCVSPSTPIFLTSYYGDCSMLLFIELYCFVPFSDYRFHNLFSQFFYTWLFKLFLVLHNNKQPHSWLLSCVHLCVRVE